MEDVNDGNGSSQSDEKENQTTEIVNYSKKDLPAVEWKTATLRVIAQLLMQETFSREECDRLTHIIKSRVVDSHITGSTKDGRLSKTLDKTVGNDVDTPDICNTAVTEAKKWFEGKKLGSNSKSVEYGTCVLNTAPHATEGETGSPVDLAKSYMRERHLGLLLPLTSSNCNHRHQWEKSFLSNTIFSQWQVIVPIKVIDPFIAFVVVKGSWSLILNRDFLVTGSWNIQEELRKVRSRATEEMLRTRPSSKMDWSALASGYKGGPIVLGAGEFCDAKNKLSNFTQLIDVPLKWGSAEHNSGFTDTQMAQVRLQNDDFSPNAATSVPEKSQDCGMALKGYQAMNNSSFQKNADAAIANSPKDIEETSHPLSSRMERTVQGKSFKSDAIPDSMLHEVNFSASKEVAGRDDSVTVNGFPSSASSLPEAQEREQKSMLSGEEHNPVGPDHDKMTRTAPAEETCKLLSEASMEVPNVNENDSVATDYQDSSSMHQEGSLQAQAQALAQPNPKRGLGSRTTGVSEKQQGRIVSSRYNKRGRGRGK
ncbi:LOW QUALITY PROTEIN: hypothetical protein NC652_018105 [Populus alba x Populus x berolinensis]|nr:LOW QUALITY PROTEIN: hypothetical protein NC652_018105 [Populus alba x Populus x berolinensis]